MRAAAAAAREKAHEAELKQRREILALDTALLERELAQVQEGSEQELALLRRKLENQRLTELAVKGLTVAQARAIDEKALNERLALETEFTKKRGVAMFEAAAAANSAELLAVKRGTDEETALRREAIDTQLQRELFALDKRKDNATQEALLRANAAKATNDVNYNAALAKLDKFLSEQRSALDNDEARGKVSKAAYDKAVLVSDQIAAGSRLQLAKEYGQETTALEKAAADAKRAAIRSVTETERAEQAKRVALAENLASGLASLFAEAVATTGATLEDFTRKALILVIDTMEKTLVAAQVKIIAESFASPESIATFGAAGLAKSLLIIAAVTGAAEIFKAQLAPAPKQFARGGVAHGPTHAQGGIQMYHTSGAHLGEFEGGEAIINRKSAALFMPVLDWINQVGGGAPLLPRAHMALGGIAAPVVQQQLRGGVTPGLDYDRLAQAMSRLNVRATISDVEAGLERKRFTDRLANGFT